MRRGTADFMSAVPLLAYIKKTGIIVLKGQIWHKEAMGKGYAQKRA